MAFGNFADVKARLPQEPFWNGVDLLAVLHRTGGLIGNDLALWIDRRGQFVRAQKLRDVLGESGNPRGLLAIGLIIAQQETVVLDHRAAARCRDDNCIEPVALVFCAPNVDVGARLVECGFFLAEMMEKRAATAFAMWQ